MLLAQNVQASEQARADCVYKTRRPSQVASGASEHRWRRTRAFYLCRGADQTVRGRSESDYRHEARRSARWVAHLQSFTPSGHEYTARSLSSGKPIRTSTTNAPEERSAPLRACSSLRTGRAGVPPLTALKPRSSLLIPLGLAGVHYIIPISAAIITLLVIVYFSYRQTIAAYPSGGGSYTVARANLGPGASLLARLRRLPTTYSPPQSASAAGVRRTRFRSPIAAAPSRSRCASGILIVVTILNLRGVREAGSRLLRPHVSFRSERC